MILVVAYKNGQECRHELCYDIFEADSVAEEMKSTKQYDKITIIVKEDDNGKT